MTYNKPYKKHFTHDDWRPVCFHRILPQRTLTWNADLVTCKNCIRMINKGIRELS